MEVSNEILWLSAGVILIALEFLAISGVGLLFAGIGALIAGIGLGLKPELALSYQWVIFLGITLVSALILYKPLKNYTKGNGTYNDMIGHKATTLGPLEPGKEGKVRWSGTVMKAKLVGNKALPENTEVTIVAVEGNTLSVK